MQIYTYIYINININKKKVLKLYNAIGINGIIIPIAANTNHSTHGRISISLTIHVHTALQYY